MIPHTGTRRDVTLVSPRSAARRPRICREHDPRSQEVAVPLLFPVGAALVTAACGWPGCELVVALGMPVPAAAADGAAESGSTAGRELATAARRARPAAVLPTSLILAAGAFGIAVRLHPALVAVAGCWLAACGLPMAIIDARQRRLPDVLTGACLAGTAALLVGAAVAYGAWSAVGRAGLGALAVAALFVLLAVARPGSAGLGDAKLGLSTGALAAWFSWTVLVSAVFAAFVLAAGYGIWLIASGRASFRGGSVPFGPFLLVGCLLAVAVLSPPA
jgi:leader peptidase (prepilin peptidase) / N-methyltransferase